jgi:hypothetical protein
MGQQTQYFMLLIPITFSLNNTHQIQDKLARLFLVQLSISVTHFCDVLFEVFPLALWSFL